MSLDRAALAEAIAAHGPVLRVVVAEVKGSAPREVGAAMLVWADGQSGTIGGGTLEYDALLEARAMLATGAARQFTRAALGPDLGQCCGGAVALLFEFWDESCLVALRGPIYARPVDETGEENPPLAIDRLRAEARRSGARPSAALVEGWFVEPVDRATVPVWVWGAGHVGRALVATLAPLPNLALTWADTAPERFPDAVPDRVTVVARADIATAVNDAPPDAHHLVLTYSHALDLALCDALLARGFASAGLIGSDTKWARFRTRLGQKGHTPAQIARITCPIGEKALGKHPQAIAVGVAHTLLMDLAKKEAHQPVAMGQGDGG